MAGGWLGWVRGLGGRCSETTLRLLSAAWPGRFKIVPLAEFDTGQKFLLGWTNGHLREVFNLQSGIQTPVELQSQVCGQGLLRGVVGTCYLQAVILQICLFCFGRLLPFDPELIPSLF